MANWRNRYQPPPDPPPGIRWREQTSTSWIGSVNGLMRARLWHGTDGWAVHLQLETPPGNSPITTLPERYGTVEEAQDAAEGVLVDRSEWTGAQGRDPA